MRLQDRVVIITGGGRGIGAATAQAIAVDGGKVVIGDMLGVAPEDRDSLLRWSDDMVKALGSPDPTAMDAAAVAALYLTTQTGTGSPLIGRDYILPSVAAAVMALAAATMNANRR